VPAYIETQFPIARLSAESFKERKANNGQTLTRLGKWWGRKPLILVRASILGMLMPASNYPHRDRAIFLKLLTMDEAGLLRRWNKRFTGKELRPLATAEELAQWQTLETALEQARAILASRKAVLKTIPRSSTVSREEAKVSADAAQATCAPAAEASAAIAS
jgi:adenine-specific DNA methylase